MFRNNIGKKTAIYVIKPVYIGVLGVFVSLLTACGGGDSRSEADAIGINNISIAYIKRPTPRDQNDNLVTNDMREPTAFTEGGDLYIQAQTNITATPKNVTRRMTDQRGDVKDVSVSYDGNKLVFSLRLEDLTNGNNVPTWNLYEYDISNDSLTPLISAGRQEDGDDISPRYLPDGRIIFASTRQTESKGIRGNEGRDKILDSVDENTLNAAFSLHVLETNGDIKQVSFNPSNDLDPIVLKDSGRILFSRWNHMRNRNDISLYSMKPDGTDVQLYYGAHSHNTGQNANTSVHFYKPREMQDGRIMAILRPLVTNFGGGDIIFIDGNNFADNTQPIWSQQAFITGTAQTVFKQNVTTATGISLNGRYNAAFPMLDGTDRYLMSWAPCQILTDPSIPFDPENPTANITACSLASDTQLNDVNVTEAPPSYGIFLIDAGSNTQIPIIIAQANTLFSEVVMTYPTTVPPVIFDQVDGSSGFNQDHADNGIGVLHIHSVYDFDGGFAAYGAEATLPLFNNDSPTPTAILIDTPEEMANPKNTTADDRPARFIRITKNVSFSNPLPDDTQLLDTAFGRRALRGMREIIGYAPVEPDGSVKIKIPANVPLTVSVLDKDGRRISDRHQYWFQVKPGETLECIGCHVHDTVNQENNKPHGRPNYASTFNEGAETTGIAFPFSVDALWTEIGETMAETRSRHSCLPSNPTPCADMKPSTDLMYSDVWTNELAANRSTDASFTINYDDTPVSPLDSGTSIADACANDYIPLSISSFTYCRIMINYQQHIQPIWEKPRGVMDADTCVNCHTTNGNAQVASGQLELTNGLSTDEADHLVSYRELIFNDNEQEFVGGMLSDVSVQARDNNNNLLFALDINGDQILDINGDPIPIMEPVVVPSSISIDNQNNGTFGSARRSYFIEKMTNTELEAGRAITGITDHSNMLTPSELKLITKWIDIGSQYFNNPFDLATPRN